MYLHSSDRHELQCHLTVQPAMLQTRCCLVLQDTAEQARVIAIPAESFGSRDDSLGGMMASASSGNSLPDLQGQASGGIVQCITLGGVFA